MEHWRKKTILLMGISSSIGKALHEMLFNPGTHFFIVTRKLRQYAPSIIFDSSIPPDFKMRIVMGKSHGISCFDDRHTVNLCTVTQGENTSKCKKRILTWNAYIPSIYNKLDVTEEPNTQCCTSAAMQKMLQMEHGNT